MSKNKLYRRMSSIEHEKPLCRWSKKAQVIFELEHKKGNVLWLGRNGVYELRRYRGCLFQGSVYRLKDGCQPEIKDCQPESDIEQSVKKHIIGPEIDMTDSNYKFKDAESQTGNDSGMPVSRRKYDSLKAHCEHQAEQLRQNLHEECAASANTIRLLQEQLKTKNKALKYLFENVGRDEEKENDHEEV